MGKIDPHSRERVFTASAAVHGGLFVDRTLRQFEERQRLDPDTGSPHEGTVHRLEVQESGDAWETQIGRLKEDAKWKRAATEESVAVARSGINNSRRASVRWFRGLPEKKQRELIEMCPLLLRLVA